MWRLLAAVVCVLVVAAGCTARHDDSRHEGSRHDGSPEATGGSTGVAGSEPISVDFRTPKGFSAATDYMILVPLTPNLRSQWRVPSGTNGYDVIFVNSYVLPRDTHGWSRSRLIEQVRGYARQVHARNPDAAVGVTTVAGLPAYQQRVDQPDASDTLHYDATFVFFDQYLVQVGCQWRHRRSVVTTGCRTVLATLRIGDV